MLYKSNKINIFFNKPDLLKPEHRISGCSKGNWIVSSISCLTLANPPMSSNFTSGIYKYYKK